MAKSKEEMKKPSRSIFIVTLVGILIVLAIAKFFGITYFGNNDILNWVSLVIEIGAASGITVFVWNYTKYEQSKTTKVIADMKQIMEKLDNITKEQEIQAELKELSEHQRYKERLLTEFERLISLVSDILYLYSKGTQEENNMKNVYHAKRSLEKVITINSMFNIPSNIRSKLDKILSEYDAMLEVIEHRCFKFNDSKNLEFEYTNKVSQFLDEDFFKNNNNETITTELNKLNKTLSDIITKNKPLSK